MITYHVCFTYADRPYWWTRILKPGFSHCYVLKEVEGGYILLNPCFAAIDLQFIPYGQKFPPYLDKPTIVVKIHTTVNQDRKRPLIQAVTCVEFVKALLGIRRWPLWTPYQLYRYLLGGNDGQQTEDTESDTTTTGV